MKVIVLMSAVLLGACEPPLAAMPAPPAKCDSRAATKLVGRAYGDAIGQRAMRETGARTVRVIRPGQAVTMDYREDRLNIHLDARNRIVSLSCG